MKLHVIVVAGVALGAVTACHRTPRVGTTQTTATSVSIVERAGPPPVCAPGADPAESPSSPLDVPIALDAGSDAGVDAVSDAAADAIHVALPDGAPLPDATAPTPEAPQSIQAPADVTGVAPILSTPPPPPTFTPGWTDPSGASTSGATEGTTTSPGWTDPTNRSTSGATPGAGPVPVPVPGWTNGSGGNTH